MRSTVAQVDIPAGALITFLQKGLEYVGIEEHINDDGSIREFEGEYSLLSPFICDAIAVKEERRYRKVVPTNNVAPTRSLAVNVEADGTVSDGNPHADGAMEISGATPSSQMASIHGYFLCDFSAILMLIPIVCFVVLNLAVSKL